MITLFDKSNTLKHDKHKGQMMATWGGMAHFAGTGPAEHCAKCTFFNKGRQGNGTCEKYKVMMRKAKGEVFPGSAMACKYFEGSGG